MTHWLAWTLALVALVVIGAALDVFVLNVRGRIKPNPAHDYEVMVGHWLPRLLGTGAVTLGRRVFVRWPLIPSASGLAHEYGHVVHTRWWRYLLSARYRRQEEEFARWFATNQHANFERDAANVAAYLHAKGAADA